MEQMVKTPSLDELSDEARKLVFRTEYGEFLDGWYVKYHRRDPEGLRNLIEISSDLLELEARRKGIYIDDSD